jgi:drug/metabolite transporter (DMT)-like permease
MINILLIAALCVVWGATWVVIKIGLSESPPFFGAAFRFLVASVLLGLIVWVGRRRLVRDWANLRWILLSGLFMYFGSYAAVYYSEQYIDAALAAILFASFPFFVAIGAHFHLPGERLTPLKFAGLTIGFAGVAVIFGGGVTHPKPETWWAMLLMLMSPFCSAVAAIIVKRYLTQHNPVVLNFLQMIVGFTVLIAMAAIYEDLADFNWSVVTVGSVLFLAVFGSAFTFVTYYYLLKTMEATKLSLVAFATPVTAAFFGWLFLDERLTLASIIGALMVFAGIYIVSIMAPRREALQASAVIRNRDPN